MSANTLARIVAAQLNPMIGCCTEDSLNSAASAIDHLGYLLFDSDSAPSETTFLLFGAVVAALRYESANLLPARQKEAVPA
jgi:hypothetical protein